jgi:prepilin-type N-terminal cleavage/methylation domain-containing protein
MLKIRHNFASPTTVRGFTLVEMAIVLVIFGLLLSIFLTPFTIQRDAQNRAKTQVLLNEAKEALMGFAVTNGYLPCPDTDAVPDGIQNRTGTGTFNCTNDEGILPWNDLGIDRVDSWNRYFRYRVDSTFSSNTKPFTIADAEGASDIQIYGENNTALVSTNSRPAAVIISHGTNGFGAKNLNTTSPANQEPAPNGADETINSTESDSTFVSHTPTPQGSANEFDDMLVWISPKVLVNRMITAERLP